VAETIIGIGDFSGGETLRERVAQGEDRKLKLLSGWGNSTGALLPQGLPEQLNEDDLAAGTIPAQVPFAFRDADGVRIIFRDEDEVVRVMGTDGTSDAASTWTRFLGNIVDDTFLCNSHGYTDGETVTVLTTAGGLTAGTIYYVVSAATNTMKVSTTSGGSALNVTASDYYWFAKFAGPTIQVVSDNVPFRLEQLLVFAEDGSDAKLTAYELASESTRSRPLSLKGPLDYSETERPTVTASDAANQQLFSIAESGTHWEPVTYDAFPYWQHFPSDNYEGLRFYSASTANTLCFTYDFGADGENLANKKYLILDMVCRYTETNPNVVIKASGMFGGWWHKVWDAAEEAIQQLFGKTSEYADTEPASGLELYFYTEDIGHSGYHEDHLLRTHVIPQVSSNGRVNRIVIHLGTNKAVDPQACTMAATGDLVTSTAHGLSVGEAITFQSTTGGVTADIAYYVSATPSGDTFQFSATDGGGAFNITADGSNTWTVRIKGLGIGTASYWSPPTGSDDSWTWWIYSNTFDDDWKFIGNELMPTVLFNASPWVWMLPTDPGDTGQAANIIEYLSQSFEAFTPDHPYIRYTYCHRGRDALSTDEYNLMISNPSLPAGKIFADPWRTYTIATTLPTNAAENSVIEDYGDYVTHELIYRSIYSGIEEDTETGEIGVWSDFEYIGRVAIAASMSYTNSERLLVDCTMAASTDLVTSTAHGLNVGDAIVFSATTGGVELDHTYYLIAAEANIFYIGEGPDDAMADRVDLTADGSNVWSAALPALELDDHDIPQLMETNHDYAQSARYAMTADGRVCAFCRKYNNTDSVWDRPLDGGMSNYGDYCSFPTSSDEDTDGQDLGEYAPDGVTVKGLLATNDIKFVFLDNQFFELVGRDAGQGWRFLRRDAIGCTSGKTIADCRSQIIWHGPDHFYRYAGGIAEPISKGLIDSSLIDWDEAHGFVYSKDRYVGFCNYADPDASTNWCRMVYDLTTDSWMRTHSTAYQLAGICTDAPTGTVYGITHDGDVINVFGGTTNYGDDEAVYTVETRFIRIAPPNEVRHVSYGVLEAITEEDSIELTVTFGGQGLVDETKDAIALVVTSGQTKYSKPELATNIIGDAVKATVSYTGATPPEIYFIGFGVDEAVNG